VELPLVPVLARMERTGIAVDVEHLERLESDFGTAVKAAADEAYAVIGKEINLGSPKQLQVVLFDELGMPKTKRTKTGYTTDADALQALYLQTEHPFLAHLLRHRDSTRLKSTVDGLLKTVADDGRIHTTFNQTIAATGRLSSTDPNLQNIPDPHRRGPSHPRGLRRRRRPRVPADRRLQPDRDAHHGRPLRGRRADRGVPVRRGPARLRRLAGLLGAAG
jgi:DNA polymerase I-like protein with 3'-5' exonuclease and polymerase domains